MNRTGILTGGTARTYNVFRKKFADQVQMEDYSHDQFLPKEHLTDHKIANFIRTLGEEQEYKPHVLKTLKAALQTDLIPYGLPKFDDQTAWPLVTLETRRWKTHLKETPYFPRSSSPLSPEAVAHLFNLTLPDKDENVLLKQEKAYLAWTVFTAMRTSDVYEMRSQALTVVNAAKGMPRRYRVTLATTKNDPDGTGPKENREYQVPCTCFERLDARAKRSFTFASKKDPLHQCEFPDCPFGLVKDYLSYCPSPYGTAGKDLRFMRARTTRGQASFTLGTMGIHRIAGIMAHLNSLLPEELQVEKVTGHSGRHTAATIAVNCGVDSHVVAQVTHHKDPRCLALYQHPDESVRLSTAFAISSAVSGKNEDVTDPVVGDEEPVAEMVCDEGNAFLQAWRVGQRRVRDVNGDDFDDYDGLEEEEVEEDVGKKPKKAVMGKKPKKDMINYYIYK